MPTTYDNNTKFKIRKRPALSYPLKGRHVSHWEHLFAPVSMTFMDVKSTTVYYECVQNHLEDIDTPVTRLLNSRTTVRIQIATDNSLHTDGVHRIKLRTKARFSRLS